MSAARRTTLLVLAALLAASLLPVAAADHVYSHRLVVTGRILGADGMPVAGAPVTLTVHGLEVGGPCLGIADAPTGPRGDFTLCRHAHEMPREPEIHVEVEVQNETFGAPVNLFTRRAVVHAILDDPSRYPDIGGQRELNRSATVVGRLFLAGEDRVENVPVHATALFGQTVDVRLLGPGDVVMDQKNATVGENGDFQVEFTTRDVPEGTTVQVRFGGDERTIDLDPRLRRADLDFVYERPAPAPTIQQPGTGEVRTPAPGALLVLAAAAAVALTGARRHAETTQRRR